MKGESNLRTLFELMIFQVVLIVAIGSYGSYNTQINCNPLSNGGNFTINESIETTQTGVWDFLAIFNPECSGMPFEAWFILFIIPLIVMIVYILPSWLAGGG